MSTVDEIFETMSDSGGEINDACFIDSSTRVITVPSMYKELGVASDEKVTRVWFTCPKIVGDNVDLTKYNLYINYQNAAGELNAYLIDDVTILEVTQGNMIAFSWLLSRHVTEAAGTVSYIVCAKKSDGVSTTNEWNTKVATGTVIANNIEPVKEIEEQNIDVIEQILTRIDILENSSGSSVSLGITSAEAGQFAKVKTVDNAGKPTSWEPGAINIPTKVSSFENDADYAKKSEVPNEAKSMYIDSDDPGYTTPRIVGEMINKYAFMEQSEIPYNLFEKDSDYGNIGDAIIITEQESDGHPTKVGPKSLAEFINLSQLDEAADNLKSQISELFAKKTDIPTVPTKTSQLENDSGYLTEHQSLTDYAKKTDIPTSLKNPNALTIKIGDTTTTYDGSEAKTVDVDVSTDESIPSYWLTHLQTKADKIREVMEAAGRNKSAFLFYTDAHWDYGAKKAPMLLKYLYNNTPINKTIFGGDIVNSESTDRDVMEYLWEWRKQVRELPNHHSVVGNHDDGNTTNNLFSTNYIYAFLLAAEETPNVIQGGDMYYYIDEPCEKTRYLYLDTAYIGINSSQTAFIKESLKTTPDNWHIVAISHIWYEPDYDQYSVRPIPIAGYGTGVESIVNLFDSYNARQDEFSSCTAKVEFCIGGHCHRDYIGRTTGGIPIILCETDSHHNRSGLTDTTGTTTESSVNAIITNYTTEKINVVRIGRGENFEVPLHESQTPVETYTNLIPTSIDTDGSVYNNSGYKAGYYISNSDGLTETSNPSYWCTGLIPIAKGDVVRIKYVFDKSTYNTTDLHYYSTLCFYNADKSFNRFKYLNDFLDSSFISGTYEWSGTNFEGTLTFTFDGSSSMFNNAKYIRVSSAYLGSSANVQTSIANAVITINEEID